MLTFLIVALVAAVILYGTHATNAISTTLRNNLADQFGLRADSGAGAGLLEFHTAAFAAKLATLTLTTPTPWIAAVAGVAQEATITGDASADASGIVALYRVTTSTPATEWEGTAGEAAEDIVFNESTWVAGDQIDVTDLPITQPAG